MRKKKEKRKAGKVILIVIGVIACIYAVVGIINTVAYRSTLEYIKTFTPEGCELEPTLDENGDYTFTTDEELKILTLSDVHIGGGIASLKHDRMALNAVACMINTEKPDLIVLTGDQTMALIYPALSFNSRFGTSILTSFLEHMGVYYAPIFGNHESEVLGYYSRDRVGDFYLEDNLRYSLFQKGPEDITGIGNYVINVRNTEGKITQALVFMDSNANVWYDPFGMFWDYDNIHEDQIEWYRERIEKIKENNEDAKSLLFMHIPTGEFRTALYEYMDNNNEDTKDTQYLGGNIGEHDPYVYCPEYDDQIFETAKELGSTQAIICGHDHYNNAVFKYQGIDLIYNYSIDFTVFPGIWKEGKQRGCMVIHCYPDGTYSQSHEHYYQDKYVPLYDKGEVIN